MLDKLRGFRLWEQDTLDMSEDTADKASLVEPREQLFDYLEQQALLHEEVDHVLVVVREGRALFQALDPACEVLFAKLDDLDRRYKPDEVFAEALV